MAVLCHTSTHAVEHLRRGLYFIQVWDRSPNPNGRHLTVWFHGNKRNAFRYLDQLLALLASFRGSGRTVPRFAPASAPASGVCEPQGRRSQPPAAYVAGGASGGAPATGGPRFALGHLVATPAALDLCREHGLDPLAYVRRHVCGDWGAVCAEDAAANERAVSRALRLLSVYDTPGGRLWVITEADRAATTVLLPSDY